MIRLNLFNFETSEKRFRFDLGFRQLLPEWRDLFTITHLKDDLIAGIIVACVALPLSLALALASDVQPSIGLVTAIVGGIVCALFGGTPLAVSGPANAMTVVIATVVEQFGMSGLFMVCFGCGALQMLTGVLGLGRFIRFVPLPVVTGFTAGIGALILIGQLPRALGLPPPDESHVFDVITHIHSLILETNLAALGTSISTLGIIFFLPKYWPRLPATLIAVLIPTLAAALFKIPLDTIGSIPNSLPLPHFPNLPKQDLEGIVTITFVAYALASLETLLSASGVDKLSKGKRHDPDQELIGQGMGNIASSLFGGMPVTGVIARSALNIQAGAKTRRAAIFHSLILIGVVYFSSNWVSQIPLAVLAGVILSVALRMLHPREIISLWRVSHMEGLIYLITFLTIVCIGLISGIQAGILAALLISAIRFNRVQSIFHIFESPSYSSVKLDGSLTFLSTSKIEKLQSELSKVPLNRGLVMDFSAVTSIDASGGNQVMELLEPILRRKKRVVLLGLAPECRKVLLSLDTQGWLAPLIASSEADVGTLLGEETDGGTVERLIYGVDKFRREVKTGYQSLFQKLAESQSPHTLFITCSDSRINPNLITSTDPGELFIVRNVGNIIPRSGEDSTPAEAAAVEFAVDVLQVKEVIVCGHSGCGAMKELLSGNIFSPEMSSRFPNLASWLRLAKDVRNQLPANPSLKQLIELNALLQLENLKSYSLIRDRIAQGKIRLHAWYYDIGEAELEEWDDIKKIFVRVGSKSDRSLKMRIGAGVQYQVPINPEK
jgi:carbonic anhydrase